MLFNADTGLRPVRFKSHVPPYKCFCLSQPAFPPFSASGLPMKEKLNNPGSLRVKVRERKRDYEVPLKLTSAARWITSKQLQRAAS